MAGTNPIPFWSGKDVTLIWFFDEKQVAVDHVDCSFKAEGETANDPIGGEDRDRLQFILTHYSVKLNAQQTKTQLIKALLEHQKMLDARTVPKDSALGFIIRPNDGTRVGYELRSYCVDDWEWNLSPGRTQRNKIAIPGRCQYVDEVAV